MGVQFPTERFGLFAFILNIMEELLRLWLWGYFKIFHRMRWKGMHLIPKTGPCIVASNHASFYDPAAVGTAIRRRMRFMAYIQFFKLPGIGQLMRFAGAFPVDTAKADRSAYENALRVLRDDGDLVIIFPEGGRTRSGALNPLKPGTARIALNADAWIVPTVVLGPEESWPYDKCVPRFFIPFSVKYYPPFRVERPESKADLDQAIDEVNRRIMEIWRRRIRAHQRLRARRGKPGTYHA
ncbi:1-acyl-sn-glycerol-3-phosphate acyltransferase [Candidatus Sumerlaeota bacterium]|nr:1-acyl-sn-glycerol-3-phosphate acyltransferase [Candidatus Sumerlaeota bacterium]